METVPVAPFDTIPDDIEATLRQYLTLPSHESLGSWLLELIKASGHLSLHDDMRWRVFCLVWLAAEYDADGAWPYLMWLNQNQPVMSDQLVEILTEAVDDFKAHLKVAHWTANAQDEKLTTFLSAFQNIPVSYKIAETFAVLSEQADSPELEPWLANFCTRTVDQVSPYIRPWHLFAAVWYSTCFDSDVGKQYLEPFCDAQHHLTTEANNSLMSLTKQINNTAQVIQWISACPDQAVKTMLSEFGHPDLAVICEQALKGEPNYDHLNVQAKKATSDAAHFAQYQAILAESGIEKAAPMLDLACGSLATQALLFHSAGYQITGAGIDIPPASLPLTGIKQRLKRGKFVKAWQKRTNAYYEALSQETGLNLSWRKLQIQLEDLTRLTFQDNVFSAILCNAHLHHEPDVNGLLAEAHRILKPNGIFVADIIPYTSLHGAFATTEDQPWQHLLPTGSLDKTSGQHSTVNKWLEEQYRSALETYFTVELWLTEQDEAAEALLSPDIRQVLTGYSVDSLTRKRIVVVARKA